MHLLTSGLSMSLIIDRRIHDGVKRGTLEESIHSALPIEQRYHFLVQHVVAGARVPHERRPLTLVARQRGIDQLGHPVPAFRRHSDTLPSAHVSRASVSDTRAAATR